MVEIDNTNEFVKVKQGQRRLQELIKLLQEKEQIIERITDSEISKFVKSSRNFSSNNPLIDYCIVKFAGNGYDGILAFHDVIYRNQGNYIEFSEDNEVSLKGTIDGQIGIHKVNKYKQEIVIPFRSGNDKNQIQLPHELTEVIINYLDRVSIDAPLDLIDEPASNLLKSFYHNEKIRAEKRKKTFESLSGKTYSIIIPPHLSENLDFFIAETKGGHTGPIIGGPGYMKTAYKLQIGRE